MRIFPVLLVSALLTWVGPVQSADWESFFNETWHDYTEELETARNEGKQGLFFFFEMDECPFCAWMKENVLHHSEAKAFYHEHFLNFMVDVEGAIEVVDLEGNATTESEMARALRVRATPVMLFVDLEGQIVHRHTGRTSGVEEFLQMGQYVVGGHYREMTFPVYRRSLRD